MGTEKVTYSSTVDSSVFKRKKYFPHITLGQIVANLTDMGCPNLVWNKTMDALFQKSVFVGTFGTGKLVIKNDNDAFKDLQKFLLKLPYLEMIKK